MPSPLQFDILNRDPGTHARVGRVTTPHGCFDTPAFMTVGTQASIKGLQPEQVSGVGAQIILANTYHLMLRPGSELVAEMGGLHEWMRWAGPILTDSGGYQVFSLSDANQISDDGVRFKSHLDGSMVELTPERSMQVQNQLAADIIMAFDDCPPAMAPNDHQRARAKGVARKHPGAGRDDQPTPADQQPEADDSPTTPPAGTAGVPLLAEKAYLERVRQACERSARWLGRCVKAHGRPMEQALFGIVQGGTDLAQRDWCVQATCSHDLPGYAIGGVAVGEGPEQLRLVVEHTAPQLPADRPRYLMGVGYERDLAAAVRAGVDMFDCVLPTRNGRTGNAFTPTGQIRLRNARFARDGSVIDPACDCPACRLGRGFSRSYLRHLFLAGEILGPVLLSLHNLRHFQRCLLDIRRAIVDNDWSLVADRWPVALDGL